MSAIPFPAYGLHRSDWKEQQIENDARLAFIECREKAFEQLAPGLDPGIRRAVRCLFVAGIETCQSCESGPGHCYPEPTVEFIGTAAQGFRALTVALENGLKPTELRRVWSVQDGEATGPHWALVFVPGPHLRDE